MCQMIKSVQKLNKVKQSEILKSPFLRNRNSLIYSLVPNYDNNLLKKIVCSLM